VEHLAEQFAGPGEILVTQALPVRVNDLTGYELQPREELQGLYAEVDYCI